MVPFSAGGVNDIVGRQWAERMSRPLGSVFVENSGGAGGTLGVMEVKRAEPDGHTILLGSASTMVLNDHDHEQPAPTTATRTSCRSRSSASAPPRSRSMPSVPAKNVKELIAYVKANAGKLSYGSAGTGTMSHLSGELFKLRTGLTDVVHVPYKGAGPGIADLVSGHIPIMSPNIAARSSNFHNTGKIRVLADQLQAAAEGRAGHSDRHRAGRAGHGRRAVPRHLCARPARPKPCSTRIADATRKAVTDRSIREGAERLRLRDGQLLRRGAGRRYMAEEVARWKPVVESDRPEDELIRQRPLRHPLLRELAQRRAVDLVGRGERQFVDEPDEARVLVGRRVLQRELS